MEPHPASLGPAWLERRGDGHTGARMCAASGGCCHSPWEALCPESHPLVPASSCVLLTEGEDLGMAGGSLRVPLPPQSGGRRVGASCRQGCRCSASSGCTCLRQTLQGTETQAGLHGAPEATETARSPSAPPSVTAPEREHHGCVGRRAPERTLSSSCPGGVPGVVGSPPRGQPSTELCKVHSEARGSRPCSRGTVMGSWRRPGLTHGLSGPEHCALHSSLSHS